MCILGILSRLLAVYRQALQLPVQGVPLGLGSASKDIRLWATCVSDIYLTILVLDCKVPAIVERLNFFAAVFYSVQKWQGGQA